MAKKRTERKTPRVWFKKRDGLPPEQGGRDSPGISKSGGKRKVSPKIRKLDLATGKIGVWTTQNSYKF